MNNEKGFYINGMNLIFTPRLPLDEIRIKKEDVECARKTILEAFKTSQQEADIAHLSWSYARDYPYENEDTIFALFEWKKTHKEDRGWNEPKFIGQEDRCVYSCVAFQIDKKL